MSNLLAYLAAGREVEYVTCLSDKPCLGMLLPQLLTNPTQLKWVSTSAASTATVPCLSAFTNLVTCQLCKPAHAELDLEPLAALTRLQVLMLDGAYFHKVPIRPTSYT